MVLAVPEHTSTKIVMQRPEVLHAILCVLNSNQGSKSVLYFSVCTYLQPNCKGPKWNISVRGMCTSGTHSPFRCLLHEPGSSKVPFLLLMCLLLLLLFVVYYSLV